MNTPNPLIPQGSLERQSKGKSTVRIAIFTIVSIHAVFFAGLLMQGCRRDEAKPSAKVAEANPAKDTLPAIDSTYYPTQDLAQASNTATVPLPAAQPISAEPSVSLPPAATQEVAGESKAYKVVKGDTFAKIAKANGVSVKEITKANPSIEPSRLKVGQTIQIPPPAAAQTKLGFVEPSTTESANSTSGTIHSVKTGETLSKIARQYGVSLKAIRAANNLKTDRLTVGQKLKLPAGSKEVSTAGSDSTKGSTVSKMTATNPAHVSPLTSNSTKSGLQ